MSQVICITCSNVCTSDVAYHTLDSSEPTTSNDLTLKEKLLYCFPKLQDTLCSDPDKNRICNACSERLGRCYFIKKLHEVKNCSEKDEIDASVKSVPDDISTSDIGEKDAFYTFYVDNNDATKVTTQTLTKHEMRSSTGVCPTCKNTFKEENKYDAKIKKLNDRLRKVEEDIKELQHKINVFDI